jgi:gas vesicle protein
LKHPTQEDLQAFCEWVDAQVLTIEDPSDASRSYRIDPEFQAVWLTNVMMQMDSDHPFWRLSGPTLPNSLIKNIQKMNNTGKILVAFASGAAVGALMGVLFAPDKGTRTRRRLKEEGMKIMDTLEDNVERGKEKLEHMREEFEKKFQDVKGNKMHSMS